MADDAKEASVYALDNIPYEKLVFDHAKILRYYCSVVDAGKQKSQ
jgi:hypothetical protein